MDDYKDENSYEELLDKGQHPLHQFLRSFAVASP